MIEKFRVFRDAIWPSKVKFAGNLRRGDLDSDVVSYNNIVLSESLGVHFKSTKLIKRADFGFPNTWHFDRNGEGFRHMAAMVLSVFDEFVEKW